ncbi:MAG: chorismate synthase, partial [Ruminococcus sp.]|nr:chorismate synthase [Ruminococcus sp.]
LPTRQQLDAICSDIPIYFADEEGHKGLVNTIALVNAGIMTADGTVLTIHGRHDPCIVPRAVPVIEAVTALAIINEL